MAGVKDVLIDQFRVGSMLIQQFTADLTDEEYFVAPMEGTNHTAWVLGHIATIEDQAVARLTGSAPRFPEATAGLFAPGSKCVPGAETYPSRTDLDEMFRSARSRTVEAIKAFDEARWDDPAPEGAPALFGTVGVYWAVQGAHQFWHIGQLAACRVALNKPRTITP